MGKTEKTYLVSDGILHSTTHKEQNLICMGYLVKSPSKSEDKSQSPLFWKVRWCVLMEVTYKDHLTFAENSRLVLYYFQDKESYEQGVEPKGFIDLAHCSDIRSFYNSIAGFHHVFQISCVNGKCIKFSPSSCKKKFIWLSTLFRRKYGENTDGVFRSKVISQTRRISDAGTENSFATNGNHLFQKPRTMSAVNTSQYPDKGMVKQRHDSGVSTSTASSISTDDEPPELPPPRVKRADEGQMGSHKRHQVSVVSSCSDDEGISSEISIKSPILKSQTLPMTPRRPLAARGRGLKSTRNPSLFDEYYFCEKCQSNSVPKDRSIKRCFSDKLISRVESKDDSCVFIAEVDKDASLDANEYDRIYQEIDGDWLEAVRKLTSQSTLPEESPPQGLPVDSVDGQDGPGTSSGKESDSDWIYERMNIYTRENTPSLEKAEAVRRASLDGQSAVSDEYSPHGVANKGEVSSLAMRSDLGASKDGAASSFEEMDPETNVYKAAPEQGCASSFSQSPVVSDSCKNGFVFSGFSEQYDTAL